MVPDLGGFKIKMRQVQQLVEFNIIKRILAGFGQNDKRQNTNHQNAAGSNITGQLSVLRSFDAVTQI